MERREFDSSKYLTWDEFIKVLFNEIEFNADKLRLQLKIDQTEQVSPEIKITYV